jgi:hypothetical protein
MCNVNSVQGKWKSYVFTAGAILTTVVELGRLLTLVMYISLNLELKENIVGSEALGNIRSAKIFGAWYIGLQTLDR